MASYNLTPGIVDCSFQDICCDFSYKKCMSCRNNSKNYCKDSVGIRNNTKIKIGGVSYYDKWNKCFK